MYRDMSRAARRVEAERIRNQTTPRNDPTGAFAAAVEEIREVTGKILEAADDHLGVDPDNVHWGHVGDANRILAALRETLAIIQGTNV